MDDPEHVNGKGKKFVRRVLDIGEKILKQSIVHNHTLLRCY